MHEPTQSKLDAELARRVAMDCSKRCTNSYLAISHSSLTEKTSSSSADDGNQTFEKVLNYAEQVCLSRCSNKQFQAKQVIDTKLKGQVQTPLMF